MEQFMQIGGVVGGLKALMVFQDSIQINQRQCVLLFDMLTHAYKTIAQEMKKKLKFEEKNTKWKVLENPLRELLRIFKEAEVYIKLCMENKDWWANAITLYKNTDCVEFHLHNLFSCFPLVIEAIEIAGELSGFDLDEFRKKRLVHSCKYRKDFRDPRTFQWSFGHQYLINQDFCNRIRSVWDEDRWILLNKLQQRKVPSLTNSTKQDRLVDLLIKCLNRYDKLLPYNILAGSKDYQVRKRLGSGSQYKEIQWLGESFAIKHLLGDIEPLIPEISKELSRLSHPNIMHILCGFTDEQKRECYLVTELMSKDLSTYIKEIFGPKKRVPFSLPVTVDLMLQIARGMEYLHANNTCHGELKPSNILVKTRNISTDGYQNVKICGFGPSCSNGLTNKSNTSPNEGQVPFIWYAPEVLEELDSGDEHSKYYTEKADVYSFGMICFELLTGKVPFEDGHLQGDKMSRNIRTGERPLFPFHSPKYLTNLTKKCWHADPNQRPSFASICRILRYIKRFLVMNPDHSNPEAPIPLVDYTDIETTMLKNFSWENSDMVSVSQIPYQMFVYRLAEKEKLNMTQRENYESGSDGASVYEDDTSIVDEPFPSPIERKYSLPPEVVTKKVSTPKRSAENKTNKQPGTPRGRSERPPQMTLSGRSMRMNSESQLQLMSPRTARRRSGIVSDSELS